MKPRIILIAVLALIVLVSGILYWRATARVTWRKAPPIKKRAVVAVKKFPALPPIVKAYKNPRVAIVMDDFGYNVNNLDAFFDIKRPITLSILPHLAYSKEISELARSKGYEVILHLPLEPKGEDVRQEINTINSRMNENEVIAKLESDIKDIQGLTGVSNHMGSKSTEEKPLMAVISKDLKKRGLYFFDSLTASKSVCQEAAREAGIRYAKRDVFLDMGKADDLAYIKKQILELRRLAFKRGRAIAVCHDRKNTIKVLSEMMPSLAAEGVRFVYLSEMVK